MKFDIKNMLIVSMLLSIIGLQAVGPETIAKLEKERKEEESKQTMPELLAKLPPDLRREILKINAQSDVLNIPAIAQGLTTLAATSKDLHAAINNPGNMLLILKSLPKAGAVVLANGLKNMPGIKSKEVQEWLKSLKLINGEALYQAVSARNPDINAILKLLENPDINVNARGSCDRNKPCWVHWTALMMASNHGHLEIVRALLAAGADVNAKANDTFDTALMLASARGYAEIVKALLAAGADVSAKNIGEYNTFNTALMMAREGKLFNGTFAQQYNATIKLLEDAEKAQKERAARRK